MTKFLTNFRAKTFIFTAIIVFANFSQNSICAQKKTGEQTTVAAPTVEPKVFIKVSQVDDAKLKEILKPKNGKPLLVNFWATWCVPCREEFPDLVKIADDYKGKVDVVTVSLDDVADIDTSVPQFLSEMKALMPTYLLVSEDESALIGSISKEWSGGLPFTILYNEKGELTYFRQGKFKTDVLKLEINKLTDLVTAEISDKQIVNLPTNRQMFSYKKGIEDAKEDVAAGKFKIKYYGLVPMATKESTDKLKQKYGIEIIYNGCIVSPGQVEYGRGYNEVSITAIKDKFGEEVLEQ